MGTLRDYLGEPARGMGRVKVQAHFLSPHSSRRLASLADSQMAAFAAKIVAQSPQTSEPARRLIVKMTTAETDQTT